MGPAGFLGFISSLAFLLAASGTAPVRHILKHHQLIPWKLWLLTPHPDSDETLNPRPLFSPQVTIPMFAVSINLKVHWRQGLCHIYCFIPILSIVLSSFVLNK